MINKLSAHLARTIVNQNKINPDDLELYHYGLFIIISESFLALYCLLIGIALHIIIQSIVFYFTFFILHRFAGGFHAKTEMHCQIITLSSFLFSMIGIKHSDYFDINVFIISFSICCILLLMFAPADTPQKKLNVLEKKRFKVLTFLVLVFFLSTLIILIKCHVNKTIISSMIFAILLETISVLFGRILNYKLL
ncbi:MAG: accessory gene regulator B family protein [Eubacterium sp.]|nr:accessory gene regulator B family protein [Eubacterium sp.]